MKKLLLAAVAAALVAAPVLVLAFAPAPDAGSHSIEYKVCNGYAESRDSALKGDASFLALTSKTEFSRIFGPVLTPRGAPDAVAKDAFDTRLFVAVIKRGDVIWDYKIEKVTANGDTLTVYYNTTTHKAGPVARGETRRVKVGDTELSEVRATARKSDTGRAATTEKVAAATEKAAPRPARKDTVKDDDSPKTTGRAVRTTEKPNGTEKAYSITERTGSGSASFDSPLIVSVPKDKYLTVIFIENGRKVGTARVGN